MLISFIFMLILSSFFFAINHPLVLTIILTTQTINLSLMIFLKKTHSWFSYMLFMIFLSGMMIIFVYISSLASNQPLKIPTKLLFMLIVSTFLMFIITYNPFHQTNSISISHMHNPFLNTIMKIYGSNMANLTTALIIYLLIVLIVIVNISKKIKLPSRTYK